MPEFHNKYYHFKWIYLYRQIERSRNLTIQQRFLVLTINP